MSSWQVLHVPFSFEHSSIWSSCLFLSRHCASAYQRMVGESEKRDGGGWGGGGEEARNDVSVDKKMKLLIHGLYML